MDVGGGGRGVPARTRDRNSRRVRASPRCRSPYAPTTPTAVAVDGIAGPATSDGVRRIQARAGLAVDGIVGPRTRRALGR